MKITKFIKSGIIGVISGLLGAFAGSDNTSKNWRRIIIPFGLAGLAYSYLQNLWVISILTMIMALSIGYGIPDETDEGSLLGRFWYKVFKENHFLADIFTRGTIGDLISLSLISIPIIKGNWFIYWIGVIVISKIYAFASWRDLGVFNFKGKKLLWSEFVTYFAIGTITSMLIYF